MTNDKAFTPTHGFSVVTKTKCRTGVKVIKNFIKTEAAAKAFVTTQQKHWMSPLYVVPMGDDATKEDLTERLFSTLQMMVDEWDYDGEPDAISYEKAVKQARALLAQRKV